MKKKILLSLLIMGLVAAKVNVNAATSATPGDTNYSTLQSSYNAGIQSKTISSGDWITIYGKSVCDSNGSCEHSYVTGLKKREDVLSKTVKCSGGEKNISFDTNISSGQADSYTDTSGNAVKSATVYWSEDIYVTCTSDSNGNIPSANEGTTNIENNYSGATTTQNPQTGVNTYFIILSVVAVISYAFMIFVKKFNLFKKI